MPLPPPEMLIDWRGDHEGVVVIRGAGAPRELDRVGDVVVALAELCAGTPSHGVATLASYGACLATRGVREATFVRPILEKAFAFLTSADPTSRALYETVKRLRGVVSSCALEGEPLRRRLLEEACAIRAEESAGS